VIGIVAAGACFLEITILFVRHLIYKLTKGARRLALIACGVAIKGWQFLKGVCKAIISNGLGACFSLIGGALGMLIPIPVINFIVSALLGTVGFILGQYIIGVPLNFWRRHRYLQKKQRKAIQ
jgi:ABC-type iron transport system FetAB permease component